MGCGVGREGSENKRESDVLGSAWGRLIASFLHRSTILLCSRVCNVLGSLR